MASINNKIVVDWIWGIYTTESEVESGDRWECDYFHTIVYSGCYYNVTSSIARLRNLKKKIQNKSFSKFPAKVKKNQFKKLVN